MTDNRAKGISAEQYADALRQSHGNISAAARLLKVQRGSVQNAVRQYTSVREAMQEAAEAVSDTAEGYIVRAIQKGDLQQARYWLENKARDRGWGAVKYDATLNLDPSKLSEMSDADLDALAAKIDKLTGRR